MVEHGISLLSDESCALCCWHVELILPLHCLAISSFCLTQNIIVANPLSSEECGVFSSFSGILLHVIQIKPRSHSQPWQKRVKICYTFVYLWRLTCFCRKHHCSASRQAESQITLTPIFLPFSFAVGPVFSSVFMLLGHRTTLSALIKYSTHRSQMQGKGEIHHSCGHVHRRVSDTVDFKLMSLFLVFVI